MPPWTLEEKTSLGSALPCREDRCKKPHFGILPCDAQFRSPPSRKSACPFAKKPFSLTKRVDSGKNRPENGQELPCDFPFSQCELVAGRAKTSDSVQWL